MQHLTKDELQNYNLWRHYWNFLTSLELFFKRELESILHRQIITWIDSMDFFDKDGSLTNYESPELEEIHFQLKNHQSVVRFAISFADTKYVTVDFLTGAVNSDDDRIARSAKFRTGILFDEGMIAIMSAWLKEGELTHSEIESFKYKYCETNFK